MVVYNLFVVVLPLFVMVLSLFVVVLPLCGGFESLCSLVYMFEFSVIQRGFNIHPYVPVTTWLIILAFATATTTTK